MVAFSTCANEGLMPQAKQGGRGVFTFAVAASKFAGTGLENEQIGQTHVALPSLGVLDPALFPRAIGEAVELREGGNVAS